MTDLHRLLGELEGAAARGTGAAPLDAILRGRRRRRAARRAGVAATSVAAVTAVVLAGTTLIDRDAPAPPAISPSPSVTPSPTPAPTGPTTPPAPEPVVLPVGDPSLPFGACGSLVDPDPPTPGTEWAVPLRTPDAELTDGEPLELWADFAYGVGADDEYLLSPEAGPRLAISHDGVVVATGRLFADGRTDLYLDDAHFSGERTLHGWLETAVCAPDAGGDGVTAGRALPPGAYAVHALLDVRSVRVGDLDMSPFWRGERPLEELLDLFPVADEGTVVSDPLPFTVTGEVEPPVAAPDGGPATLPPAPDAARDEPTCGAPAPVAWDAGGTFRLTGPSDAVAVAAGEWFDHRATLIYTGGGRLETLVDPWTEYTFSQDGAVVGTARNPGSGAPVEVLRHGTRWQPESIGAGVLEMCDGGSSLRAGTYTVHPGAHVAPGVLTTPTGERFTNQGEHSEHWITVWGEPFTLVVE